MTTSDERCATTPAVRYSYAYQPIVDIATGAVFSYEALIRGPQGESAADVFQQVAPEDRYRFDRESRLYALALAGRLGLSSRINLNVLPRGMRASHGDLQRLIDTTVRAGLQPASVILEVTESEAIGDTADFLAVIDEYRGAGFKVALDDVGAGYAGLNLLADFQPDFVKLDMSLVRDIDSRGPRQSIARALAMVCGDLGIDVIAEGVETDAERAWFANAGITLQQGYLLSKPAFERLVTPSLAG